MAEEFGVKVKLIPEFDSNALKTAASTAAGKNGIQVNLLPVINTKKLQDAINSAAKNLILNINDVNINGGKNHNGSGGSGGGTGGKKSSATNIEPLVKYYKNLVDYIRKNPSVQKSKTLSNDLSNEKKALASLVRSAIQTGSYDKDRFTGSKNKVAAIQNAARIRGLEDTSTPNKVAAALQKQVSAIRDKAGKYSTSASDTAKVEAELKKAENAIHQLGLLGSVSAESFSKIESSAKAALASADSLVGNIKASTTDISSKMSAPANLLKQIQQYRAANPALENYGDKTKYFNDVEAQLKAMMSAGQYSQEHLAKIQNSFANQKYDARSRGLEATTEQGKVISDYESQLKKLKQAQESISKSDIIDSSQLDNLNQKIAEFESKIEELRTSTPGAFDRVSESAREAGASAKSVVDNLSESIKDTSDDLTPIYKILKEISSMEQPKKISLLDDDSVNDLKQYKTQLEGILDTGIYSKKELKDISSGIAGIKYRQDTSGGGTINTEVMSMVTGITAAEALRTAFYKAKQVAIEMVTAVKDIDDALTQLTVVTGKTGSQLDSFFQSAADSAYNMGHSVSEVLGSVETFTRLGYGLEDASTLANAATVMSNVADTTVDASTTGLTSIIKGYGLDASDATRVSDVLAKVGKDYAISAEELMSALERGGAALNVANTSFEESVALAAAGNAAIQDPEKVGGQ